MPNWTTNAVAMRTDDMEKVLTQGGIDFNRIRPMPADLDITEGSITRWAMNAAEARRRGDLEALEAAASEAGLPYRKAAVMGEHGRDMECETADDLADYGERYLSNLKNYGSASWYRWRIEHWGTKWNASTDHITRNGEYSVAVFWTAWDRPDRDMLLELAARCKADVWHEWAHEDYDGLHAERLKADGSWEPASPYLLFEDCWDDEPDLVFGAPTEWWTDDDVRALVTGE